MVSYVELFFFFFCPQTLINQSYTWYLAMCLQPPQKLSAKSDPSLDLMHVWNGVQKRGDHEAVTEEQSLFREEKDIKDS